MLYIMSKEEGRVYMYEEKIQKFRCCQRRLDILTEDLDGDPGLLNNYSHTPVSEGRNCSVFRGSFPQRRPNQ